MAQPGAALRGMTLSPPVLDFPPVVTVNLEIRFRPVEVVRGSEGMLPRPRADCGPLAHS